jgi:hypothetical protein
MGCAEFAFARLPPSVQQSMVRKLADKPHSMHVFFSMRGFRGIADDDLYVHVFYFEGS